MIKKKIITTITLVFFVLGLISCQLHSVSLSQALLQEGKKQEALQVILADAQRLPEDYDVQYQYAQALYANLRYTEAGQALAPLIKNSPFNGQYRLLFGKVYWKQDELNLALKELKRSLSLNPSLTESYYYLGEVYRSKGEEKQALANFNRFLNESPNHFEGKLAQISLQKETAENVTSYPRFITEVQKLIVQKPESKEAVFLLADLYRDSGEMLRAERTLAQYADTYGMDTKILYKQAYIAYLEQNYLNAEKLTAKISTQDTETARLQLEISLRLGRWEEVQTLLKESSLIEKTDRLKAEIFLLFAQEQHEKALSKIKRISQTSISDGSLHYLLALTHQKLQKAQESKESIKKALSIEPDNFEYKFFFLRNLIRSEDYIFALEYLNQQNLSHENVLIALAYGDILTAMRQFMKASDAYNKAIRTSFNPELQVRKARLALLMGNRDDAKTLLKQILKLNPTYIPAKIEMGKIYLAESQYEQVKEILKPILNSPSTDGQAHIILAESYFLTGDTKENLSLLKKGMTQFPKNHEILNLYTIHLGYVQKFEEAIIYLVEMQETNSKFRKEASIRLALYATYLGMKKLSLEAFTKYLQ